MGVLQFGLVFTTNRSVSVSMPSLPSLIIDVLALGKKRTLHIVAAALFPGIPINVFATFAAFAAARRFARTNVGGGKDGIQGARGRAGGREGRSAVLPPGIHRAVLLWLGGIPPRALRQKMVSLVLPVALPVLPALPVVGGGNAAEGGILAPGAESGDRVPERGPFENKEEEKGGGGSYMRE